MSMSVKYKNTAHAKLMGWDESYEGKVCPYDEDDDGKAQFAEILLKYFSPLHFHLRKRGMGYTSTQLWMDAQTQASLLDEVLIMKGIDT